MPFLEKQTAIYDTVIIGGGILGCFCALNLARCSLKTLLLEKREDVCTGISKANTAIIYPGYDNCSGSLKTTLTLKANQDFEKLCMKLDVPFFRCGSILVSEGPKGGQTVTKKYRQGIINQVPGLQLLSARELLALEPGLTPKVSLGLYAPSTGTVHPWELGIAAWEAAKELGAQTLFHSEVTGICKKDMYFYVEVNGKHTVKSRSVINCAGILADQVQALYSRPLIRIRAELAEYMLFEQENNDLLKHIIFSETEEGKGISLVPTLNGKILAGPISRPSDAASPLATSDVGHLKLMAECEKILPNITEAKTVRNFAGFRPNPYDPADPQKSLRGIEPLITDTKDGLISLIGIKTPGLTCSHELGKLIRDKILDFLNIDPVIKDIPSRPRHREYLENPAYQKILCRCEGITLGEVLDAVQRGATTIDGVKRRTGSGMGLCQGNHCSARIAEILSATLSVPMEQITKDGPGSFYLFPDRQRTLL